MKINKKLSRLGLVFMLTALFAPLDTNTFTQIMFYLGEAMFLIWGGLDDMEENGNAS